MACRTDSVDPGSTGSSRRARRGLRAVGQGGHGGGEVLVDLFGHGQLLGDKRNSRRDAVQTMFSSVRSDAFAKRSTPKVETSTAGVRFR